MNPGVQALERLVKIGVFEKGTVPTIQYWPTTQSGPVTFFKAEAFANVAGLIHQASSWVGSRGLSVIRGRAQEEVIYVYRPKEDR